MFDTWARTTASVSSCTNPTTRPRSSTATTTIEPGAVNARSAMAGSAYDIQPSATHNCATSAACRGSKASNRIVNRLLRDDPMLGLKDASTDQLALTGGELACHALE